MYRVIRAKKLSLRQILIASLMVQVLVAVGSIGYFSWLNGRKTIESLALRLSREVTSHTQKHIFNYLNTPSTFLRINRVLVNSNHLDIDNIEDLQTVFWHQTQINPQINTLHLGRETGDFIEIEMKDPPKVSIRNANTAPYWETYRLSETGKKASFIETRKYDPRQRPWYISAKEQDDLAWSPVYLFVDPPVLGVTPAIPLKDAENKITGVMAIDLTLDEISEFLNSLEISDSGRAFIMDKSGKMVATSTSNSLVIEDPQGNKRRHYSESPDPLIKATGEFLAGKSNNFQNTESWEQLIFKFDRSRHFVQTKSLDGYAGLDWIMVTVIPESDFSSYMRNNTYTTISLSVLALIAAIFLGAIANQLIIQSVTRISQVAKAISQEQIMTIDEQPRIEELAVVTQSLNSMASQLQNSAQNIKRIESRWEKRVEETTKNLKQVNQELNRLANVDSLTQIHNRYHFDLALRELWQEAIDQRSSIALIFCDIDHFKLYNDTYGHLKGDECIRQVAQAIGQSVKRNQDIAARYGGEEFAVILPRTNCEGAVKISANIHAAIANLNISHSTSTVSDRITISCGVACAYPSPDLSPLSLVESADRALYQAKQQGRNRSILAGDNTASNQDSNS